MIVENNIGWCDVTGNPGIGCRGCELGDDCYALNDTPARVLRSGHWPGYKGQKIETFGSGRTFVPTKKGLSILKRLNQLCICDVCHVAIGRQYLKTSNCSCGGRLRNIRFFADSNSDWMDWPIDVLTKSLDEIRLAPNVNVILLTKWPELWKERILKIRDAEKLETSPDAYIASLRGWLTAWLEGNAPVNVWTLTSVTTQKSADRRILFLRQIPSVMRGLSVEPLWEKVELKDEWLSDGGIGWIIVGCDSSKHHKGWENYEENARSILLRSMTRGIRVYHKQQPCDGKVSQNPMEWREDLRIRQFPTL